jgi:phage terminase large subunit
MPAVDLSFIPKFQPLWRPNRYKIIWGGRGGAKRWTVARMLLAKGTPQKIRVLCLREFQKSIAESVYKLLENQIQMMGLGDFYTLTKTSIRGTNGTEFFFEGLRFNAHKIKSYEDIDYAWV